MVGGFDNGERQELIDWTCLVSNASLTLIFLKSATSVTDGSFAIHQLFGNKAAQWAFAELLKYSLSWSTKTDSLFFAKLARIGEAHIEALL